MKSSSKKNERGLANLPQIHNNSLYNQTNYHIHQANRDNDGEGIDDTNRQLHYDFNGKTFRTLLMRLLRF